MIDHITPAKLTEAIKYNNGGKVIPSDVKAELDEFHQAMSASTSEEDRAFFQKAIDNINSQYVDISPEEVQSESGESSQMLTGGNWFKNHPDKMLGQIRIDKDRFGKEVRVLVGDISLIDNIDAPLNFEGSDQGISIGISTQKDPLSAQIKSTEVKNLIETLIDQSNISIGQKIVNKNKKKSKKSDEEPSGPVLQINDYKKVYQSLNPNISNEELKAYLWYKDSIGQRLSNEWYEMAEGEGFGYTIYKESEQNAWVNDGILFYYDGKLLPLPIYASGNIYEKVNRLIKVSENSGQDIEYIKSKYGEAVLKNQIQVLNNAFSKVYGERLVITGNMEGNSLILKPTSEFARTFMIDHTESNESFRWWKTGKLGRPAFDMTNGSEYKKEDFEQLSLTHAFCLWMAQTRDTLELKGNISYIDIIYFYIDKRTKQAPAGATEREKAEFKAALERTKAKSASEGIRLFNEFLYKELDLNLKLQIETSWNSKFNNYLKPDYNKIPVAFNITNDFFGEMPFEVKPEKREAVSFIFNEGSGCLAYDVGVGKSLSAIMIMEQFIVAGYAKRPFLVIPNQTYKQWLSEIKNALPHRKVNALYNLSADYIAEVMDENNEIKAVDEGSITVLTEEGFLKLGFSEQTENELMDGLYEILNQGMDEADEKDFSKFYEKLEKLIGKGLKGGVVEIEKLKLDFMCVDEAHSMKKVFTSIKSQKKEGSDKDSKVKDYSLSAGLPSSIALKGFMLGHYILKNNNYRNILLLTATPFTNSPLEVFSMLSMVAYHHLKDMGISNINSFFDQYIDVNTELTINHKMQPQYKQVVKGFNNLASLQKIIFRFFNYKTGEDVGVVRPNKIVIPHTKTLVNGSVASLPIDAQISSHIEMTELQKRLMSEVIAYAEGKGSLRSGSESDEEDDEEEDGMSGEASVFTEDTLSDKEKAGVRALKAMNHSRNIAVSPYMYTLSGLKPPTYKEFIKSSPKLEYVTECIKSVKKYHEKNNEPVSGQVIYLVRGVKYFELIKQYLIYECGFKDHEVAMITGQMKTEDKRYVQDSFLGRRWNNITQDYDTLEDAERVKILIGSSAIKEGMNLQTKSSVLYDCIVDWNPTDALQVQGRIWRQKNEFKNVRIVIPLTIDSIDIFMYQKLEEKTARINSIWSVDNKSVFKLDEINPEDIKMALIKDPKIIAGLEIETKGVQIRDDISSNEQVIKRLEEFKDYQDNIEARKDDVDAVLKRFAPSKLTLDFNAKINYLIGVYKAELPKDGEGRVMLPQGARERDYIEEYGEKGISPYQKPFKQYWWADLLGWKRHIEKEKKDLLASRNIDEKKIDVYIKKYKNNIEDLGKKLIDLKSEKYISKRVEEINEKRANEKFELKSIPTLVGEFSTLNNLLSVKYPKSPKGSPILKYDESVFLNENGLPKIDKETIAKLTQLSEAQPQTKAFYVDENGNYTDERQLLHLDIINKFKKDVYCIQQDQPIAILTGGPPASGKSTFLKTYSPYLADDQIMKVDADAIRAMLPEYQGWNSAATHLETKDIVNTLLTDKEIGIPCKYDIIYDGTMNRVANYEPLIGTLKRLGYKIYIVYMDKVPYKDVVDRMLHRYQTSKDHRFVPIDVIDDFFTKGKDALHQLKSKVDGYMVIDASDKEYRILEKGGEDLPTQRNYVAIGEKNKAGKLVAKLIQASHLLK